MGIFTSTKNKEELVLVFDVGSASVGGALFCGSKHSPPKIIYSIREPIALEATFSIDKFFTSTLQSLGAVALKVHKQARGAPAKIFCVLSSPWHVSQTRVVTLAKNTHFTFTSKVADSLIQKEVAFFKEEHFKKYVDAGSGIRLIEVKNVRTTLNGYDINSPINQKAKEVQMALFLSMSPEQILKKMEACISKYFSHTEVHFSSFTLVAFAVLRDLFSHMDDFLLVDIGGEVTDICMVKKNMLRESTSFPSGRNFLIRGVATGIGSTLGEAESLISLFTAGHAAPAVAQKLSLVINNLKTEWLRKFQEALAGLSGDISIPATIYLATEKDLADLFCDTVRNEQFNQYILTESKFEVILLDTKVLHGLAIFDDSASRDPNLILDSIYINRFLD